MTIEWTQFVWGMGLLILWSGFLVGIIRSLIGRLVVDIEKGIAEDRAMFKALDAEFKKLLMELPIHYQRREDSIREYTVINAKLDRLYDRGNS